MQKWIVGIFLMSLTTGCSKANFSSDDASGANGFDGGSGEVNVVCNEILQNSNIPIKIIISVDTSGSNVGSPSRVGTDPNKSRRGGAMTSFINQYASKTNFGWSLLHFQDDYSDSLIGSHFVSDITTVRSAVDDFYQVVDRDGTPYMAALDLIQQNINSDPSPASDTKYIVVFISDGKPDPEVPLNILTSKVGSIKNIGGGSRVSFSTIYYGPTDNEATSRLQAMAAAGSGSFLNASNASSLRIQDVVTVPGTNCN